MGFNVKKAAKKAGGSVVKAVAPVAKVASSALATPAGKVLNNALGGMPGAATSIAQGKNPLVNTPVGAVANAVGLGKAAGTTDNSGAKQAAAILAEAGPKPEMAKFSSILDANGNLSSKYSAAAGPAVKADQVSAGSVTAGQLDLNALAADPRALDAMRARSLATGDSPWAALQKQQQGLEELNARDRAGQQALGSAAMARSQLAMKGGLGGGSRERLALSSARDLNAQQQGIGRAGQLDRLGIGVADEQQKMSMLGQTAGLDLSKAGQQQDMSKFNIGTNLDASKFNTGLAFDASKTNAANNLNASTFNSGQTQQANQFNTTNAIGGVAGQNAFNTDKFKTDMMGYAAGKQGAAIAAGGGKK